MLLCNVRRCAVAVSLCVLVFWLVPVGFGQAERINQLSSQLNDPDPNARVLAAQALGQIGGPRAVSPLLAAMDDKDWRVRLSVVNALGKIKDPRAIQPLKAALKDADSYVRDAAADALSFQTGAQSGQAAPDSSATPPETQPRVLAVLQTSFLVPPSEKNDSCSPFTPDYAKYHTIVEILDNKPIGLTQEGGDSPAGLPVYNVNTDGSDPVSGEGRRMGFTMTMDASFTKGTMHQLLGQPGTRITFHGDSAHPFAPIPGISLWDGSIDIDPKCGMVIRAHSLSDAQAKTASHPPKAEAASTMLQAQRLLKSLGYDPGPIDGKPGARTVEAIKAFQRHQSLPVDGQVSPALIAALNAKAKVSANGKK